MKNAVSCLVLMLFCLTATGQTIPPVMRYNGVAESMYLLERCGEMTDERWEWLENVRMHAMRSAGWDEAQAQAHDRLLIAEFRQRYRAGVAKDRCNQLARATDQERKTTVRVP
jgi:hypothetical protein